MITLKRHFTNADKDVFDMFGWSKHDVVIKNNGTGEIIFEGRDLEFPDTYNRNAVDIIAKMYFRKANVPVTGHEVSMKQVVNRMADFWRKSLIDEKMLDEANGEIFFDEVRYIMLKQLWAPNTPQWFNTGMYHSYGIEGDGTGSFYYDQKKKKVVPCKNRYERTSASACFITRVKDTLLGDQSLSDNLVTATRLFSYGSGVGSNWSDIRGAGEALSGGGVSSGVMSFLKVFDKNGGAIKSGGMHRRSSIINVLDMDHPEILDFINWKCVEEDKVRNLGKMGYDISMNGEAYETVSGQNSNNSVSIPDKFMELLDTPDAKWQLKGRIDPKLDKDVMVQDLWNAICYAAWACGDPGVQYSDIINSWNTVSNSGRIRGSNPCFTYDSLLLTKNGYRKIGDLSHLEEVQIVSSDGEISNGKVFCSGEKDTVKVVFDDNTEVSCTPDHRFMLSDGSFCEAKDLLNKEVKIFVNKINKAFEVDEYFQAGYDMNPDDITSMKVVDKKCNSTGNISPEHKTIRRNRFFQGLLTKHGSIQVNCNDIVNSGNFKIIFRNPFALDTLKKYLEEMGIHGYVIEVNAYGEDRELHFKIRLTDSLLKLYGNILYNKDELLEIVKNAKRKVVNILPGNKEPVYDFTEPLNHVGVVNGNVVHNCSEFLFLEDNACNLSSINVKPFWSSEKKEFDFDSFLHVIELAMLVMESTAHWGAFPTHQIAENTYKFRPVGLGISNLGSLLMSMGFSYGSDDGRNIAAFIMSTLTSMAYNVSANMAKAVGPFEFYEVNKEPMMNIIMKHMNESANLTLSGSLPKIFIKYKEFLQNLWNETFSLGSEHGYRNAMVSLCAPCGTISFAMNCESTGIEPFFSNIVYKKIADGSFMSMTNEVIPEGLNALGFNNSQIIEICKYIEDNHGMIEGAPYLNEEQIAVFDTASKNGKGDRCLSWMDHLKMLAAIQPHISASSSKTVNAPNETTVEEIGEIYKTAWKMGIKCIAIYRDGCKATQPLTSTISDDSEKCLDDYSYKELLDEVYRLRNKLKTKQPLKRERLPYEPLCIKNEIQMDNQTFHIIRSFYEDGRLGEIFVTVGKNGSTVKGLQEVLCMVISKALQYGVPVDVLARTLRHHEFSPNGFVHNHPNIKSATSIPDLMSKFLDISEGNYQYCQVKPDIENKERENNILTENTPVSENSHVERIYGERCTECGSDRIIKAGICKYCQACGASTGCS